LDALLGQIEHFTGSRFLPAPDTAASLHRNPVELPLLFHEMTLLSLTVMAFLRDAEAALIVADRIILPSIAESLRHATVEDYHPRRL